MNCVMESLSHWDYATEFSGPEAAALILGIDPNNLEASTAQGGRIKVVAERMAQHYEHALMRWYHEILKIHAHDSLEIDVHIPYELTSLALEKLCKYWNPDEEDIEFEEWLVNDKLTEFSVQKFSRHEVYAWLQAIGEKSAYQFNIEHVLLHAAEAKSEIELDPSDLPEELDAANMAFRAVSNAKGKPTETFRKRIIAYLKENHPNLTDEAIKRISTLANSDKSPGRKKFSTE